MHVTCTEIKISITEIIIIKMIIIITIIIIIIIYYYYYNYDNDNNNNMLCWWNQQTLRDLYARTSLPRQTSPHICHLTNSYLSLCSEDCFKILDSSSTSFQLKIKVALHLLWEQPSINSRSNILNYPWGGRGGESSRSHPYLLVLISHFAILFIAYFYFISYWTAHDGWWLIRNIYCLH